MLITETKNNASLKALGLLLLGIGVLSLWALRARSTQTVAAEVAKSTLPLPSVSPTPSVEAAKGQTPFIAAASTQEKFAKVTQLTSKALLSAADLQVFHQSLSDEAVMGHAVELLLDTSPRSLSKEAETQRMQAVDYLDAALLWKANPKKTSVIRAISAVVQRPLHELDIPKDLKKSLVGDVVEIYGSLYREEPAVAQDLFNSVDTEQRRLLGFAQTLVHQAETKPHKEKES